MSREAMEACQDFTRCTDSIGRNVLIAIARFIQLGPDGWVEGWVGLREMARLAGCDKDTAAAKVKALEALGEISTRKEGQGRATKVWFTLLLPMPQWDINPTLSQPERDNKHWDNNQVLSQQVKVLSQQIELLSQQVATLSQLLSQNVPMPLVVEENNTITPVKEHQEHLEEPPCPPTDDSPQVFPFTPARSNKSLTPADERVAMIIRVCGLDLTVPDHVRQAQNAAAQLANYSAEVIKARYANPNGVVVEGWNWYWDDWRGQKGNMPRPGQVVETISLAKQDIPTPQARTPVSNRQTLSRSEAGALEVALLLEQEQWNT